MSELSVGYGEAIITPPQGTELAGYGFYLRRRATSVLDELKVRALFLHDGMQSLVLISCDLLGFDVALSDTIRKEIAATQNIPEENILLAAIHTHSGPAIQSIPGLGEVDPDYIRSLPGKIKTAVELATNDSQDGEFRFFSEHVEPIGYNRRMGNFHGIDSQLTGALFKRRDRTIYLLNYACHPVVLGRTTKVSADWPGAVIREIEKKGDRGIFFQGFCGNIDPVTNMNRWGGGEKADLELYGEILSNRIFKAERYTSPQADTTLKSMEKRVALPLKVWTTDEIERIANAFMDRVKEFPGADRFANEWKSSVPQQRELYEHNPFIENVPLQALTIGGLKILGLPGEVFAQIGLNLKKHHYPLITVGYANGNVGYIPTAEAYQDANDYAAYFAPMFYSLFPFTPGVEKFLVKESLELLS